ncbi:MAG: sensor histidine kinase [Bacteroidota bacterium]
MESQSHTETIKKKNIQPSFGYWNYDYNGRKFHFSEAFNSILGYEDDQLFSLLELGCMVSNKNMISLEMFWYKLFEERENAEVTLEVNNELRPKIVLIRGSIEESRQVVHGTIEDISIKHRFQHLNDFKIDLGAKIERITKTGSFEWKLDSNYLVCSDNFFYLTHLEGHNQDNKLHKDLFFSLIDREEQNFVLEVMHECVTFNKEFEISFHTNTSERKKFKLYGHPYGNVANKKLLVILVDISQELKSEQSVIYAQDTERKRISLELHDSVGQKLIAVKFMFSLMQMTKDMSNYAQLNQTMDTIIEEIRSITHNLSTRIVSELGLKHAIAQLIRDCAAAIGAQQTYTYEVPDDLVLSEETTKMIYRIVQEALTNAMKYSEATELSLSLKKRNRQFIITLIDNGKGFDLDAQRHNGIGLQNIRQRVSYLNGFLKIDSKTGMGTFIKVKIPVKDSGI